MCAMTHLCATRLIHPYSRKKTKVKIAQRWSSVNEDEEKGGGGQSKSIFFRSYPHNCMPASILFFLCVTFFCWHRIWVQSIWAYLQETCMRPHVCPMCLQKSPTCHQYNPISQRKSLLFNQKWQAWRLICAVYVFKRAVYRMKRGLQCIGVTRIDLCNMSRWNHVYCSVLQCVLQYVLIHVRRLPGTTCVVLCCSVCCSLCWFMRDVTSLLHICDPTPSSV